MFRKVLFSLGTLGALGGVGTGIYFGVSKVSGDLNISSLPARQASTSADQSDGNADVDQSRSQVNTAEGSDGEEESQEEQEPCLGFEDDL